MTAPSATDSELAGGSVHTSYDFSSNAFGIPSAALSGSSLALHKTGDALFDATFVPAPALINPGLGPLYNGNSCGGCHINDGKGNLPNALLIRLSVPGSDIHGISSPVPGFGNQLQNKSIPGTMAEGQITIAYLDSVVTMLDGMSVTLRKPSYKISNTYIPLPADYLFSPRMAPVNFGLGLLEAIDEQTILSNADPADADQDGISGKANYVYDIASGTTMLGRFGWKANQPSLKQQAAGALNGDMNITTSLFPQKNCEGQSQCAAGPDTTFSITNNQLDALTFYLQSLAVPARRNVNDAQVQLGKSLFINAKCSSCHLTGMTTGNNLASVFPALSNQSIQPFTDLLLHDMGPALADNRPDFLASGTEWRTTPLWGIGLLQITNGNTYFLHDGRATTPLEAILWHGGEAEYSREYVKKLSKTDRDALLTFLQSL